MNRMRLRAANADHELAKRALQDVMRLDPDSLPPGERQPDESGHEVRRRRLR